MRSVVQPVSLAMRAHTHKRQFSLQEGEEERDGGSEEEPEDGQESEEGAEDEEIEGNSEGEIDEEELKEVFAAGWKAK